MLSEIVFKKDFRCFKAGTTFKFRPGINFIVGDQGSGKSSLIYLMRTMGGDKGAVGPANRKEAHEMADLRLTATKFRFYGFDFEKENPRTINHLSDNHLMFQVGSMFRSHGETVRSIAAALEAQASEEPYLVLFDEPDASLSPKSAMDLLRTFNSVVEHGGQVIASVHNPLLMLGVNEVLSLEHGGWLPGREFLAHHGVSLG